MVLYCNRFIILFTLIIHNKTKNIFNLTVQLLEKYNSTVWQLAHRDWHQVSRQEELLPGGGRRGGIGSSGRIISNRRWRGSCNSTHVWHWWNTYWHLWKFAYRGLTVHIYFSKLIELLDSISQHFWRLSKKEDQEEEKNKRTPPQKKTTAFMFF